MVTFNMVSFDIVAVDMVTLNKEKPPRRSKPGRFNFMASNFEVITSSQVLLRPEQLRAWQRLPSNQSSREPLRRRLYWHRAGSS